MRILFQLPRTNILRHFDSVVLTLADAGHDVTLATPGKSNDFPLPEAVIAYIESHHLYRTADAR